MNVNFSVFIDKILSGEKRQTIRRASPKWQNVGFWEVGIDIAGRFNDAIRALPAPKKSVVRLFRTTRKVSENPTLKQGLRVADAPKTKRIGKQAMRSSYAKIAKKLKGPTGKKDIK